MRRVNLATIETRSRPTSETAAPEAEAADAAWKCHVSQAEKGKYEVYTEGPYDSQVFGLYRSLAGEDAEHRDFFENIPGPEDFMVVSDGD